MSPLWWFLVGAVVSQVVSVACHWALLVRLERILSDVFSGLVALNERESDRDAEEVVRTIKSTLPPGFPGSKA